MGVCPEKAIKYPRINSNKIAENELSAGHTHLFMVNNEGDITDEEEDEREKEETVIVIQGKSLNKG